MEKLRKIIINWLGFSRTEANGFLILVPLMILLIVSEPAYRWFQGSHQFDTSADAQRLDSLMAVMKTDAEKKEVASAKPDSVFAFDPNKIAASEFRVLGFSENLSNRIANYRQKGGVFRIKRDLLKIYGMDTTLYHQLFAYILLPEAIDEIKKDDRADRKPEKKAFANFDINKADTAQLKSIYGIGNVLAVRIVNFRNGLGGFIAQEQFAEVYGLDSLVATRLKEASYIEKNFEPRKININTSDEKTLLVHPYIKKSVAKAILAYRFQHGEFADVRDLLKIAIIPPQLAERLIPYLKVKD
jgi:DNA uptake protein ComE-like DNA-binding protein